jgi:hypothetical protein
MQMTEQLAPQIGLSSACQVLGVPRSSLYRARQPKPAPKARPKSARALSGEQKAEVRQVLNSERFRMLRPARSMPAYWMTGSICATGERCIGF